MRRLALAFGLALLLALPAATGAEIPSPLEEQLDVVSLLSTEIADHRAELELRIAKFRRHVRLLEEALQAEREKSAKLQKALDELKGGVQ